MFADDQESFRQVFAFSFTGC